MLRIRVMVVTALLAASLLLSLPAWAASRLNCVQYVKQVSGLSISGDAWKWWDNARGKYGRGEAPKPGAVMVFKRGGKLRYGHVAVVSKVIDSRTIAINHANWVSARGQKGTVQKNVLVRDDSPNNDWTRVRVWYDPVGTYGSGYLTYGFIYISD